MHVASETWGDEDEYYLKAAVKFADEFEHWGGFGAEADGEGEGEGKRKERYGYPENQGL
jgi:hypothetical protein